MRKKVIRRISIYLLVFLVFCTMVSRQVQRMVLPQVTVSEPVPGMVEVDGRMQQYEYTVPSSALVREGEYSFLYYIMEMQGKFGDEQIVLPVSVRVLADDGITAALSSGTYGKIVTWSDKRLEAEMRVLVSQSTL